MTGKPPFSLEVKIKDEKGRKIFHLKPSQHNLVIGIKRTNEFIKSKLGIDNIEEFEQRKKEEKKKEEKKDEMSEYIKRWFGE